MSFMRCFIQPSTLSIGDAYLGPDGVTQTRLLKSLPAQFNAAGLVEQQFLATSADGTKVSYLVYVVHLFFYCAFSATAW
jgi:prolyl oligopeptidase PreP (S9A serine peptidase family)